MKIRIKGNSLRLRLSQSECSTFGSSGVCVDEIKFGPSHHLRYSLRSFDGAKVGVCFSENEVSVWLPSALAKQWVETDQVGISGEQKIDDEATLAILVEKDFACLVPRSGEQDSDSFPNPLNQ